VNLARSLRVFLAVALLAAWTNALVHPIAHVDEAGEFVHLAGGHAGDSRNEHAPDPLCDAVAAVVACVNGSAGLVFPIPVGAVAPTPQRADEYRSTPRLAYLSQAPPQHS
jgi:hypothetical protein